MPPSTRSIGRLCLEVYIDEVDFARRVYAPTQEYGITATACDERLQRALPLLSLTRAPLSAGEYERQAWRVWDWTLRVYAATWLEALALDGTAARDSPPITGTSSFLVDLLRELHTQVTGRQLPMQQALVDPIWWATNYACQEVRWNATLTELYFGAAGLSRLTMDLWRSAAQSLAPAHFFEAGAAVEAAFFTFIAQLPS